MGAKLGILVDILQLSRNFAWSKSDLTLYDLV